MRLRSFRHRLASVSASPKDTPAGYPEFAVRRETISRFFHPPLPTSTFHDMVNRGKIIPVKGLRGFYRLNESLRRMGLREVPAIPSSGRSTGDIIRLALTSIDPAVFPAPAWLLEVEEIDPREADHARLIADLHRDAIEALETAEEKMAYAAGVLDAQHLIDQDH